MATHVRGSERGLLHEMPRERERMPAGLQLAQKKQAKVSYYYVPTAPRAVPWCNVGTPFLPGSSEEPCQRLGLLFPPLLRRM